MQGFQLNLPSQYQQQQQQEQPQSNQFQTFQPNKDFELSDEEENNQLYQQQSYNQQSYINNSHMNHTNLNENSQMVNPDNYQELENEFVVCPQHPESKVTQICLNESCNEPLCAQCIIQHKLYHQELNTEHKITSINQVRVESLDKLEKLINLYNVNKKDDNQLQSSKINLGVIQNNMNQLKMARKQVEIMLNDYFNELEKKLSVSQGFLEKNQFEYYDNLKQELQGQYYIQALLEVLENKDEFDAEHIKNAEHLQNYEGQEIVFNQSKIYSLKKELSDFVFLKDNKGKVQLEGSQYNSTDKFQGAKSMAQNSSYKSPTNNAQNLIQSVPTQQQQQKHSKQPIFASPTNQNINQSKHYTIQSPPGQSQQQLLSKSNIKAHNLLPVSHSPSSHHVQNQLEEQIQQQETISKKKQQEKDKENERKNLILQDQSRKIPLHKERLSKLNQIDDKLSRLRMRLENNQLAPSNASGSGNFNNTINRSDSKSQQQQHGNSTDRFDSLDTKNQQIMQKITHKYNIPVSQEYQYLEKTDVVVSSPQTDIDNQVLMYFQENSKKMYSVDCSQKNISINDITVQTENQSFKVPQYHRTVVTPTYGTFLIGGIFNSSPPFVSTDHVYQIDHKYDKELKLHSRMNYNRSSPGVCYCENDIYVCGGYEKHDESSSLDTFEKLDLVSNKWISLARCNFKATGCALAPFHGRYIFKFGGKQDMFNLTDRIEYYDTKTDSWHVVVLPEVISQSVQIGSDMCAIQINDNQILFFGGLIHSAKQNAAYILDIDNNYSHGIDNDKFVLKQVNNMSRQAGVTSQPILRDGEVLTFVDSINNNDISVSYYNRKCVCSFNGTSWKEI